MRVPALASAAVLAGILVGAIGALAQPADQTSPPPTQRQSCFFVTQFDGWRAQDERTMFIRVNMNRFYRLDMSGTCPALLWPNSHLIMNIRGPNTICSPLDWDLKVSSGIHDIPTPCIVKAMTPLTQAEADAIPKKFKP